MYVRSSFSTSTNKPVFSQTPKYDAEDAGKGRRARGREASRDRLSGTPPRHPANQRLAAWCRFVYAVAVRVQELLSHVVPDVLWLVPLCRTQFRECIQDAVRITTPVTLGVDATLRIHLCNSVQVLARPMSCKIPGISLSLSLATLACIVQVIRNRYKAIRAGVKQEFVDET